VKDACVTADEPAARIERGLSAVLARVDGDPHYAGSASSRLTGQQSASCGG
jgi:hypothetical protein